MSGGEGRVTFVLGLGGAGVARNKVLIVVWSEGVKVHRPRNIQQDHRIVRRYFRSVVGHKRRRHDLLRVACGGMLNVAGIVGGEVFRRRLDRSVHPRTRHVHLGDEIRLHPHPDTALSVVQHPVEPLLGGVFVATPRGGDPSPASGRFDAEFQGVRSLVRPSYGDRLEVAGSKQVQILNGMTVSEIGNLIRHANFLLVGRDEESPLMVWPSALLFC